MYALILAAAALIALMAWVRWARRRLERISDTDLAGIIEHYLYGGGDAHDWGNFVERPFRCTRLERLRNICVAAEAKLPEEREAVLAELAKHLRRGVIP